MRASIAREYKIKEDLELGRGKANDKGQLRSTVAGEIAYEEIKNRLKKGDKNPVSASNFEIAKIDKDSEVTADLADKDIEAQYFNTLKYASAIGDGSWENNPKILEEMRGATGEITDFTSKSNYFLKTIDKEWAETKEGKKKIAIADGIIESLNKNSSDKEYYKIIDGRKKEVIIASNPKAKSYVYHLGKSISAPFRTDEYKVSSFNPNRSFTDDVKELTGIVLGGLSDLSKPFTLGIGSKLGDESGRVGKGSSQYGTREVVEGKQEFVRSSIESATDIVVTPIVMKSVGVGISKGKEIVNNYKYSSYISDPNVPYDGVKKLSKYLQDIDVNRVNRKKIINSFVKETIQSEKAGLNQYGIRFYDIDYKIKTYPAYPEGQYLFETFTPYVNRENLALPPSWNQMTAIKQFQIKPETLMFKGKAAPQFLEGGHYIYPGGAPQIFIYRPDIYKTLLEIKY